MSEAFTDTRTLINHIYSYRPRSVQQEKRQTGMNRAMLEAAIKKLEKVSG